MFIGMPIVFALLAGPGIALVIEGHTEYFTLIFNRLYNGIDSFALMALPFFVLAGELMRVGGITNKLINLSESFIGHYKGGLAQAAIVSSTIFSSLTGSAVAATSALGTMLIPEMEKRGYKRSFAATLIVASTILGPIIPPSTIMIVYAYVMNISVAALFAAGIIPGILMCIGLMIVVRIYAAKYNFPVGNKSTLKMRLHATYEGFFPLLMPVIILGSIYTGICTATEAAAVAVAYAIILCFIMKTIKLKDTITIFKNSAISSGVILLLVGVAVSFGSMVSISGIPPKIATALLSITNNKYLLLFIVNILFIIVGMFLDAGPAILILAPIIAPVMTSVGINPLHFGAIMCINLTIGLATPPMGLALFVGSGISKIPIEKITSEIIPFLVVEYGVVFLMSFIPEIALFLPKILGLV
jgi:tripartite ATP-independent transporter DctM subunit